MTVEPTGDLEAWQDESREMFSMRLQPAARARLVALQSDLEARGMKTDMTELLHALVCDSDDVGEMQRKVRLLRRARLGV